MKSFEVNGKSYDSMSDFCKKNGIRYGRFKRICRIYLRAHRNPAIAARWVLGLEYLNKTCEPKTDFYFRDKLLSAARQMEYKARQRANKKRLILKLIKN